MVTIRGHAGISVLARRVSTLLAVFVMVAFLSPAFVQVPIMTFIKGADGSIGVEGGNAYGVALRGNELFFANAGKAQVRKLNLTTGVFTTVAGNEVDGYSGDNGSATSAQLSFPRDIAVASNGSVYISDINNNVVRRVSGGVITTIAGTGTSGFSGDNGQATQAQLGQPTGVAVYGDSLYIADYGNGRVRLVILSTGIITTVAGGDPNSQFSGDGSQALGAGLLGPRGIVRDGLGNLYISDSGNHRIRKVVLSTGIITTVAGSGPTGFANGDFGGDGGQATSARLNQPLGIAVDGGNNLFIADQQNNRIRKFTVSTGVITTVAGDGTQSLSPENLPATQSSIHTPYSVAVDTDGSFYFGALGSLLFKVGTPATPTLSVTVLPFTATLVGQQTTATVTVTNNGPVPVTLSAITHTGPDAARYSVSPTSATVPIGGAQVLTVTFTPTSVGWANATLSLAHNAAGIPSTVGLVGIGKITPPTGNLAQTKIAFTDQRLGTLKIFEMNTDGTGQTELTPGWDSRSSWAPDGRNIAFQFHNGITWQIYKSSANGTGRTRLTINATDDEGPEWSPDGTKIAFWSTRDGNREIYVMNVDGTNQTRLTTNAANDEEPGWSPDGTKIAFMSQRDGLRQIYVMNADGTNQTRLSTASHEYSPSWSPDGTKIVFPSFRNGNFEIYVMNADGSNQTRLTNNVVSDYVPAWSPDGTKITFTSERDGNAEIYVMNTDGTDQTRLTNNPANQAEPAWSPFLSPAIAVSGSPVNAGTVLVGQSGNQTFTVSNSGTWPLIVSAITRAGVDSSRFTATPTSFTVAPGAGQTVIVTFSPTTVGGAQAILSIAHSAAGSPASVALGGIGKITPPAGDLANTKIAYVTAPDTDYEIYAMAANGTNPTRLTTDPGTDLSPAWSPDGQKLAFASDRDGDMEIYVMNADGSSLTRLTTNSDSDDGPIWSPDGSKLAFSSSRDGNDEIYVMNANGTNPIRLTNNPAGDLQPAWSPDGSKLAFSSSRDGNDEIYVMNANGTNPIRLTNNSAYDNRSVWSPDGTKIAFFSLRDGNFEIYVMASDGSGQTNVTGNAADDLNPTWSPDGTKLAFASSRTGDTEIYTTNADGTNPVALTVGSVEHDYPAWSPFIPIQIAVDSSSVSFGSVAIGASASRTVTISNPGTNVLTVTAVTLSGPNVSQFSATPASFSVPGGGNQVVTLTYTPTAVGPATATLSLTHNAVGSPMSLQLSGIGQSLLLTLGQSFAQPGETVSFPLTLDNGTVTVVGGLQLTVVVDTTLARFVSLSDSLADFGFDAATSVHGDSVRVVLYSTNNDSIPSGTRVLGTLTYQLRPSAPLGSSVPLTLLVQRIGDPQAQALQATAISAALLIGIRGDVNIDALIDVLDLIRLSRLVIGRDTTPSLGSVAFAIGDVNRDGALTVQDIVVQAIAILGLQ